MDPLSCGVCKQRYAFSNDKRKPKFLQCFHTFCANCLTNLITNNQIPCPTCQKLTAVGKKGASSLQDNTYIQQYIVDKQHIYQSDDASSDDSDTESEDKSGSFGSREDSNAMAQIWCETCLKIANTNCLENHEICNYKQGMSKLEVQLQTTIEQAGQMLERELSFQEPMMKYVEACQVASNEISKRLNDLFTYTATQLQTARSEMEELASLYPLKNSENKEQAMVDAFRNAERKVENALKRFKPAGKSKFIWDAINGSSVVFQANNSHGNLDDIQTTALNLNITEGSSIDRAIGFIFYCLLYDKLQGKSVSVSTHIGSSDSSWTVVEKGRNGKRTSALDNFDVRSVDGDVARSIYSSTLKETKSQSLSDLVVTPKESIPNHNPSTRFPRCYFDLTADGVPLGRVVFELRSDVAPKMCQNFIGLCTGNMGYGYKGSKIFKAHINDHIVGGDFVNNDGTGGYSIFNRGLFIADNSPLKDQEGTLRMRGMATAPTGEGLVGSQFHIWVGKRDFKDFKRTLVIGKVVQGLDICKRISNFRTVKTENNLYVIEKKVVLVRCGQL